MQRCKDKEIQTYKDPNMQLCISAKCKMQSCKAAEIQRCKVAKIAGCKDATQRKRGWSHCASGRTRLILIKTKQGHLCDRILT